MSDGLLMKAIRQISKRRVENEDVPGAKKKKKKKATKKVKPAKSPKGIKKSKAQGEKEREALRRKIKARLAKNKGKK